MQEQIQTVLDAAKKQAIAYFEGNLAKADDDTEDEATAKKKANKLVDEMALTAFDDLSVIEDGLIEVAADSGALWAVGVKLGAYDEMFNQVHERAVDYAKSKVGELVSGVDQATKDGLKNIVSQGLLDGIGKDGIVANIKDSYAFSDERSELIARTEIGNANSNGVLASMHESRERGLSIKKIWIPDALACDQCLENGDAGAIALDDEFPSGDDAPLAHPNCRCAIGSEVTQGEDDE